MRQMRRGVFETNSSSVHSITMCMSDDFDKWVSGELFWDRWGGNFVSQDVVDKWIEESRKDFIDYNPDYIQGDEEWECKFNRHIKYEKQFYTYDEFNDYEFIDYETFVDDFVTPNGERIVSFGYYGHD